MLDTSFRNASGLPDRRQHTSARDMLRLGVALMRRFPHYYRLFSTDRFTFKGRTYHNHNRLLGRYLGADGIKTGYVRASGFNLVASATRNDHRLVGVVLGGKSAAWRDRHMSGLLDVAFAALARFEGDRCGGIRGHPHASGIQQAFLAAKRRRRGSVSSGGMRGAPVARR